MVKKVSVYFLFTLITIATFAQSQEYKRHLNTVLRRAILNKTFVYNTIRNRELTTTSIITYLGKTMHGDKVLHIQETYPAAAVRHGYLMLLIISSNGKKYLYRDIDKPQGMTDGILIFKHKNEKGVTYHYQQNLNKEIPKYLCVDKNDCFNYYIED